MNETLFDIALFNLRAAYKDLVYLGDDPRELNRCGYTLQQGLEIALKYIRKRWGGISKNP